MSNAYTLDDETIKAVRYEVKNSTKTYQQVADLFDLPKKDVMGIHLGRIKESGRK